MLHDPQQVEDAFQVTFIVFLRKAHSLHRRELLGNWLYGVAYRTALKARGALARHARREQPLGELHALANEGELVERDVKLALDQAVNQLPAKYRQPIIFCYLEGNSVNEAAARIGCPAGTVAGRLARAKEMLRKRLIKRGITVSAPLLAGAFAQDAPAGVPAALITATCRTVAIFARGEIGVAGDLSPSVSLLTEGVLKSMFVSRIKIAAATLLTIGALAGGIVTYSTVAGQQPQEQRTNSDVGLSQQPTENQSKQGAEVKEEFPTLGKEKVQALLKESQFGDKIAALLAARYEAAFDEVKNRQNRLVAGKETLDIYIGSSLRLLEAERELSTKKAPQLLAFENHWQRMKMVYDIFQQKFEGGSAAPQDLAQARFSSLQAEIWVVRAKAK